MKYLARILAVATLVALFSGMAQAAPMYVGSWRVDQGPSWYGAHIYSGQQAAALLFGGSASDYFISTTGSDPTLINHLAWYSGFGSGNPDVAPILPNGWAQYPAGSMLAEGAVIDLNGNGLYDLGDYSAYIQDWAIGELFTNYAFVNVNVNDSASVPEPGTMVLLGAGLLGLACYAKRRKQA